MIKLEGQFFKTAQENYRIIEGDFFGFLLIYSLSPGNFEIQLRLGDSNKSAQLGNGVDGVNEIKIGKFTNAQLNGSIGETTGCSLISKAEDLTIQFLKEINPSYEITKVQIENINED